jgi:hypothetical protein
MKNMKNRGSLQSVWKPILIVFIVALLSYFTYYGSRRIENQAIHQPLATFSGIIYFLSIFFGPLFIFTTTYVQGVPLGKRIFAASAIPFLWMTKDVILLMESHPFIECLYWYFNPLTIWMVCLLAIEMGFGTILGRVLLKRRGRPITVISVSPIIAILIGAVAFGGIYAWGQGENLFSLYLDGYRLLFGSGI